MCILTFQYQCQSMVQTKDVSPPESSANEQHSNDGTEPDLGRPVEPVSTSSPTRRYPIRERKKVIKMNL